MVSIPLLVMFFFMAFSMALVIVGYLFRTKFPPSAFLFFIGVIWLFIFLIHDTIELGYAEPTIDTILTSPTTETVTESVLYNYANTTGWTQTGTQIAVSGGFATATTWQGGSASNRQSLTQVADVITIPLSNNGDWHIDSDFRWTLQAVGGTFHILSVTSTEDWYSDNTVTIDGISIAFSYSGGGRLVMAYQDGTSLAQDNDFITGINASTNYYLRLERIDSSTIRMSVFSDSSRITHVSGSPVTFTIPATVTGLDTIQHTNAKGDGTGNTLTATMDNTKITQSGSVLTDNILETYTYNDIEPITYSIKDAETLEPTFIGISLILVSLMFIISGVLIESKWLQ